METPLVFRNMHLPISIHADCRIEGATSCMEDQGGFLIPITIKREHHNTILDVHSSANDVAYLPSPRPWRRCGTTVPFQMTNPIDSPPIELCPHAMTIKIFAVKICGKKSYMRAIHTIAEANLVVIPACLPGQRTGSSCKPFMPRWHDGRSQRLDCGRYPWTTMRTKIPSALLAMPTPRIPTILARRTTTAVFCTSPTCLCISIQSFTPFY
mmetsp:Transcript_36334/g.57824  ORF Transcript_36334/g.57824 Transcript_36334/m.57824 type:complete len:211 (+) Transcript_36334:1192-1824(+)